MTNLEVAMEYLRCFCAGDIDGLEPILASDLSFTGPFHSFDSSKTYLDSLRNDPPERSKYKVLSVTENQNSVASFYDYEKPDQVIKIAQLFKIKDKKIFEILLIFDGRGFT